MKIVFTGDSIAFGLGVRGSSYCDILASNLSMEKKNFAQSAMKIDETAKIINEIIEISPKYIIISTGITEAIIRPKESSLKYLPRRWRKSGWMDPRPYYSSRWYKRILERIESGLRWRVKNRLITLFGGITQRSESEYESSLTFVLNKLVASTDAVIIVSSHFGIDDRYFPGSNKMLGIFADIAQRTVENVNNSRVLWIDMTNLLNKWDDFFLDRFHPNHAGHLKIANRLLGEINNIEKHNKITYSQGIAK